jgi:predicted amidohydrolase
MESRRPCAWTASGETVTESRTVTVRCVELAPRVGDLTANLHLIDVEIGAAAASDVDLLVLPELATSGYVLTPGEARACALRADTEQFTRWAALLRPDQVVVLGFCEDDGDLLRTSALVLTSDGVLACHRKTHLWGSEHELFVPGDSPPPLLQTPLGAIGVLVCYELEFPELPRQLALSGADLIVVPTSWPLVPRPDGEHPPEVVQAMAAARASRVGVVCCDRRGEERGTRWTSGSCVVGTDGWLVGGSDPTGRLDARLVLADARRRLGPRNDAFEDRRPALYERP